MNLRRFLGIIFLITMLQAGVIMYHEQSHKTIYREAGCNNISVTYYLDKGQTTANCDNLSYEMHVALFQAQANVESYYSLELFPLILFGLMFI